MLQISHIQSPSETSLIFYFKATDSTALTFQIADFAEQIRPELLEALEIIPCTASLSIEFHILESSADQLVNTVRKLLHTYTPTERTTELLELPIYYHPEVAPDLESLAKRKNLSITEVIKIHSDTIYTVASLGFAPGFAYLTGLDSRLAVPRNEQPKNVAKGSLGIADQQTAIYPTDSPGGWSIIGNCPVDLFDLKSEPITPFRVGMQVKFNSISQDEFLSKGGKL